MEENNCSTRAMTGIEWEGTAKVRGGGKEPMNFFQTIDLS